MAYGNAFQNNAGQMNYMQMQASQNQAYMNQPSYLQATSAHNVPQMANNYMQGTNPQYNGYPNNAYMGQYAAYRKWLMIFIVFLNYPFSTSHPKS